MSNSYIYYFAHECIQSNDRNTKYMIFVIWVMRIRSRRKPLQYNLHFGLCFCVTRLILIHSCECQCIWMHALQTFATCSAIMHYVCLWDNEWPGPPQPDDHSQPEPVLPREGAQAAVHAYCDHGVRGTQRGTHCMHHCPEPGHCWGAHDLWAGTHHAGARARLHRQPWGTLCIYLVDAKAQHTIFACHVFLWQSVVHAAMSASRATLVSSAQTYVTRRVHEIKKINCASTMTYIYTVHPSVSVLVTLTVFQVFSTFQMNFHLHCVVHPKRRSATQLSHACQDG